MLPKFGELGMGQIRGTVLGIPTCADPAGAGVSFTINDGGSGRHLKMAGPQVPGQSPLAAEAAAALLAVAAVQRLETTATFADANPRIATRIALAGKTTEADRLQGFVANPLIGPVAALYVGDANDGSGAYLGVDIDLGSQGTAVFETNDPEQLRHWTSLLALALVLKTKVTLAWTYPTAGERKIRHVFLGG